MLDRLYCGLLTWGMTPTDMPDQKACERHEIVTFGSDRDTVIRQLHRSLDSTDADRAFLVSFCPEWSENLLQVHGVGKFALLQRLMPNDSKRREFCETLWEMWQLVKQPDQPDVEQSKHATIMSLTNPRRFSD